MPKFRQTGVKLFACFDNRPGAQELFLVARRPRKRGAPPTDEWIAVVPASDSPTSTVLETEQGEGVRVRYVTLGPAMPRIMKVRPAGEVFGFDLTDGDTIALQALIDGKPLDEELWGPDATAQMMTPGRSRERFGLSDSSDDEREPLRGLAVQRSASPRPAERRMSFEPAPRQDEVALDRARELLRTGDRPRTTGRARRRSSSEHSDPERDARSTREPRRIEEDVARFNFAQFHADRGYTYENVTIQDIRATPEGVQGWAQGGPAQRAPMTQHAVAPDPDGGMRSLLRGLAQELRSLRSDDGEEGLAGDRSCAGTRGFEKFRRAQRRWEKTPAGSMDFIYGQQQTYLGANKTLYEFLTTTSQTQNNKYSMMLTHLVCSAVSAAEARDLDKTRGLLAKMLVFMDQAGRTGQLEFAWKLTLQPEPPNLLRLPRNFPNMPAAKGVGDPKQQRSSTTPLAAPEDIEAALGVMDNMEKTTNLLERVGS